MASEIHENLVFISLESFILKAFFFKLRDNNRKDSYQLEDVYTTSLPLLWDKDPQIRDEALFAIMADIIKHFQLGRQDVFFKLVTSDPGLADIKLGVPLKIYIKGKTDYSLVPYFSSSYLDSFDLYFAYLNYYSMIFVDNHGNEIFSEWESWKEIAKYINASFNYKENTKHLNVWMNNLVRPVIGEDSFYLSAIAAIMLGISGAVVEQKSTDNFTILAGGEVFSWIKNPEEVIFSIITGVKDMPSFVSVYHDTGNILSLNKALKDSSLKLLEMATGKYVRHAGDVLTIKAKKEIKPTSIIGKINIHDENGFKTVYPVADDIMKFPIHGVGSVTMDLHYPFFVDGGKKEFKCRDFFVIDTRIKDRGNIMNFKGWYDRIKSI